jgi:hypothetical protein
MQYRGTAAPARGPPDAAAMRTLKRLLPIALAVAAAATIAPAAASAAVPQACPAGFTVQHNDSIGLLAIPAGTYQLTVADPSLLTCDEASDWFQLFLQDFDGRLPKPWTLDPATATFSAGNGIAFQIARLIGPGPVHPEGRVCPGTFRVLHNDRIGALRLPAGRYHIVLAPSRRPTCSAASQRLAAFLQRPSGQLPAPWRLNAATATFSRPGGIGFRLDPA